MDNDTLLQQRMAPSMVTLGAASTLAAAILREVVGNDISDSLNGSALTQETIVNMTNARVQQVLGKD